MGVLNEKRCKTYEYTLTASKQEIELLLSKHNLNPVTITQPPTATPKPVTAKPKPTFRPKKDDQSYFKCPKCDYTTENAEKLDKKPQYIVIC